MRKRPRVSRQQLDALLREQNNRCALTGLQLTPQTVSLDHVQPLSRGGSTDLHNCQLTLRTANHMKGSLTHEEFVALCRAVIAEDNRQKRRKKGRKRPSRARKKRGFGKNFRRFSGQSRRS